MQMSASPALRFMVTRVSGKQRGEKTTVKRQTQEKGGTSLTRNNNICLYVRVLLRPKVHFAFKVP